jgi:hypothetical protein
MTSLLSGDRFTSYMLLGSANNRTHAGRRRPPDTDGSNMRQTSPISFETLGRSTGRPFTLKNCKSRAAVARGDDGAWEISPSSFHRFPPPSFLDDEDDDDDDDDDDLTAGDRSISILARPERNFVPSIDAVRDSSVLLFTLVSISSLLQPFFDLPPPPPPPPALPSPSPDAEWTSVRLNCVPRHMMASVLSVTISRGTK